MDKKDKKNVRIALFVITVLWIILLIGILAYNPYNKNNKTKVATDRTIHYFDREVISNKPIRILGGKKLGYKTA